VLALFIKWADGCAEEELLAVGRPGGVGGTMRHIGELAGFAAIGGEKPDLRFAFAALLGVFFAYLCRFALTVGDEGEPAPVGRPGRAVGVGAAAGEALCFTTAGGDDPD